jgi:hypothetical protein
MYTCIELIERIPRKAAGSLDHSSVDASRSVGFKARPADTQNIIIIDIHRSSESSQICCHFIISSLSVHSCHNCHLMLFLNYHYCHNCHNYHSCHNYQLIISLFPPLCRFQDTNLFCVAPVLSFGLIL